MEKNRPLSLNSLGRNFALPLAAAILFLTAGYHGAERSLPNDKGRTEDFADKTVIMNSPSKWRVFVPVEFLGSWILVVSRWHL